MKPIYLDSLTLIKSNPNSLEDCQLIDQMNQENEYLYIVKNSVLDNKKTIFNTHYFVYDKQQLVASVQIGKLDYLKRSVYLAYGVVKKERYKAYGTKLLCQTSNYLFLNHPWINKINLCINESNKGSIKVANGAGFILMNKKIPFLKELYVKEYQKKRVNRNNK